MSTGLGRRSASCAARTARSYLLRYGPPICHDEGPPGMRRSSGAHRRTAAACRAGRPSAHRVKRRAGHEAESENTHKNKQQRAADNRWSGAWKSRRETGSRDSERNAKRLVAAETVRELAQRADSAANIRGRAKRNAESGNRNARSGKQIVNWRGEWKATRPAGSAQRGKRRS